MNLSLLMQLWEFKSFSAIMGIYKERLIETYMIRPRIPGGCITLKQLKAISEIAKKYGGNQIRFTTRQDIQFHSVKADDLNNLLEELMKAELTTKAAGGDGVRNIACSPLSGVATDEIFDVTPYMKAVANYMMDDPKNLKLPRKYKIAFSNSLEDTVNATITDIGFIAKIVDGKRGFEVYGAGGLGRNPSVGIKLEDFIDHNDALYYVQAMKQIFEREGDRTNRHKARLRFVLQRLGEEKFREVLKIELDKVRTEKDLKLNIDYKDEDLEDIKQINQKQWDEKYQNRIINQKQEGHYSVYIHPISGNVTTDNLDIILDFLTNLNYKVSLRLTMTQGFFVRDLKENDAQRLIDITCGFSSIFNIDSSVVCAGAKTCKFGINKSQGLLNKIIETFKDKSFEIKNVLPQLFISGCPNSCAQPQKGIIGLIGKRKRTEDGMIPTYAIMFNGKVGPNIARVGQVYGEIPAKKIPNFLEELAQLKVNSGYEDFVQFVGNKEIEIRELVDKYSTLESISENSDLYSDFE
ncbi:nitrite/sulfite reductase [Clostridium saccharobutylicum]|uniref:Ferredoxin--nitrite reductase NirA n=4 Tax=Clostridium saccharobutylicum TaxID=169679 RepID=U5MSC5_CLOSA|nr:nitrite/sulfite reductase [Clostridium saccharobutylicum]AGX43500.1 ferredoxin--nitrite reductase NirA [Clostridium saccharobutylicum DSM 13864]AQR90796.1 sulfite reductase [Clostridium saccharobutylicum]AQS00700.1 sulfite reductase [Clostridium saccharobutylicum]AQS10359.1 sulfite reductase [Clostridium saccharobutylicum]AQS14683.1 sulfite reductase [Clostridium saccharobutylicum]